MKTCNKQLSTALISKHLSRNPHGTFTVATPPARVRKYSPQFGLSLIFDSVVKFHRMVVSNSQNLAFKA